MEHTLECALGSGFCLVIFERELALSPWRRFCHAWITPWDTHARVWPEKNNMRGPGSTPISISSFTRVLPLLLFINSVITTPEAPVTVFKSNGICCKFIGPSFKWNWIIRETDIPKKLTNEMLLLFKVRLDSYVVDLVLFMFSSHI